MIEQRPYEISDVIEIMVARSVSNLRLSPGAVMIFKFGGDSERLNAQEVARTQARQEKSLLVMRLLEVGDIVAYTALVTPAGLPVTHDDFDRYVLLWPDVEKLLSLLQRMQTTRARRR